MHDIYLILGSIQSLKQEVALLICATTKLEGAVIKWKLGSIIYSGLLAIVTTHTVIIIYTEYFGNESSKSSHNQI